AAEPGVHSRPERTRPGDGVQGASGTSRRRAGRASGVVPGRAASRDDSETVLVVEGEALSFGGAGSLRPRPVGPHPAFPERSGNSYRSRPMKAKIVSGTMFWIVWGLLLWLGRALLLVWLYA